MFILGAGGATQVVVQATCSHVPGQITYNQPCVAIADPQCGSDGITYSNKCHFNNEACKNKANIKIVRAGACNGGMDVLYDAKKMFALFVHIL